MRMALHDDRTGRSGGLRRCPGRRIPGRGVSFRAIAGCLFLFVAANVCAEDDCHSTDYAKTTSAAEQLVLTRPEFSLSPHIQLGSSHSACAVIEFSIGHDGEAFDYAIKSFSPSAGVAAAAKRTLAGYKFAPPAEDGHRFTLLFSYNKFAF
jgi:hypothetical protein